MLVVIDIRINREDFLELINHSSTLFRQFKIGTEHKKNDSLFPRGFLIFLNFLLLIAYRRDAEFPFSANGACELLLCVYLFPLAQEVDGP